MLDVNLVANSLRMKRPPLIRTTEEVKIKLDLLEVCMYVCVWLIILQNKKLKLPGEY